MDYSQSAGLPALMANYGNISQGMNPGQQPPVGGNPYFPSMPLQQQYQPAPDFGGFAPGQLNAQYGTPSTYGTQDGMVNYGYGPTNMHPQYTEPVQPVNVPPSNTNTGLFGHGLLSQVMPASGTPLPPANPFNLFGPHTQR